MRARAGRPGAARPRGARSAAARGPAARRRRRHRRPHRPRRSAVPDDADRLRSAQEDVPRPGGRAPGGRGRLSCRLRPTRSCCSRPWSCGRSGGVGSASCSIRDPLTGLLNQATLLAELGVRGRLRPAARRTAVPAGLRPGRLPRGERAVRAAGGRPGAAPRRQRVPLERARERPHRPVRRRGVRDGAAGRAARRARRWWRPSCAACSASSRPPPRRASSSRCT